LNSRPVLRPALSLVAVGPFARCLLARCLLARCLLAGCLLAGCTTSPVAPPDSGNVPAQFKSAASLPAAPHAESQPRGQWWQAFADPTLNRLVVRADQQNQSIQVAAARLAQARALVQQARAERLPQVGLNSGASRRGGPLINAAGGGGNLFSTTADLTYEADLFGRLAQAGDAAALDAQSREALLQSTRLLVQADVARSYLALRALDAERRLLLQSMDAYRDTVRLTERRAEAGYAADLDVVRARADLAATEADALGVARQRAELEHALALLLGEPASAFSLPESAQMPDLPSIPPGIPSSVLARRSDVSAAQRSAMAAQQRLGLAQKSWLPSLALTASGGFASSGLSDLFRMSMRAWGVGALLALPVFDGGRRQAGLLNAQAEVDALVATYRQQVLVAFRDVEDQLSSLRLLADQAAIQQRAVQFAVRATELSESRYRSGSISQLDLLDARRTELRNRRQALQVEWARYQATVGLIRALGGGWDAVGVAQTDSQPLALADPQAANTDRKTQGD